MQVLIQGQIDPSVLKGRTAKISEIVNPPEFKFWQRIYPTKLGKVMKLQDPGYIWGRGAFR